MNNGEDDGTFVGAENPRAVPFDASFKPTSMVLPHLLFDCCCKACVCLFQMQLVCSVSVFCICMNLFVSVSVSTRWEACCDPRLALSGLEHVTNKLSPSSMQLHRPLPPQLCTAFPRPPLTQCFLQPIPASARACR